MNRASFALSLLLLLPLTACAAPQTQLDTDFGTARVAVNDVSADGAKRITGVLPEGWIENSGWSKEVVISYERRVEGGRAFLRVTKTSGGPSQLAWHLGEVPDTTFCRLEFTARSASQAAITVGIRDRGAPYDFHWSVLPELTDQWQDYAYEFRLDRLTQPVGLWINLGADSSYDLARVSLVTRNRDDIIADLKARYPEGGSRNLVRVSRFPLGLPTGWSLDRDSSDGDRVKVKPDPAVVGPSGGPSLSIASADPWRIWTAPVFIGRSFEPHTASLYVRGSGQVALTVFGDGRQLRAQAYDLTGPDQWQRLTLTFNPLLLGQMHQLRLDAEGRVWLDAFQIERGSAAIDYAPQMGCEVSLGVPESDASPARIQFTDEPALIRYAVTQAPAGATLRLRVADLYGKTAALPEVKLTTEAVQEGTVTLPVPKDRSYGSFRLEARVEDARGQALSPYDEVVVHRLPRPHYWEKQAPRSPFGVHTLSTTRHILMAKAVGANWTRLHDAGTEYIGWAHLEPEQGKWTFRDLELQRYCRHGLRILGLLSTAPLWANVQETPARGYFDRYAEPKDLSQFANYVRVVTQRYKGLINAYDVWNEPWGTGFWHMGWDEQKKAFKRSPTASEDYTKLQQAAFEAAKAEDPSLTILGFNSYGAEMGRDWTADLLKFGAMDACDAFCYHHYSSGHNGYPGDDVNKALDLAIEPIVKQDGRVPKPIWMTEGSGTTRMMNNGFYNVTACGQATDDNWRIADRLCRYMVSLLARGVTRFFLYTMHDTGPFRPMTADWRVLVEDDGFLHPSGVAHAHLAWLLEDTAFVKTLEPTPGVYAHLFQGLTTAVAVLATKPGHAVYTVPTAEGVQVTDLFGNPVAAGTKAGDLLLYLSCEGQTSRLEKLLTGA
jgi:hypothetical protein